MCHTVVSTVASQQRGAGFGCTGKLGPFLWSLSLGALACFLSQSKDALISLTGDFKLAIGVSVRVTGCWFLYV